MESFFLAVIRNRHLVLFLTLALLAGGLIAYQNLPLEAYPDIANMQVRVITKANGKAAQEVEKLVTIPLERELNGIPHSSPPRSISIFGLSVITVIFDDNVDPNTARQQVLERIHQADVPPGLDPQIDPNASPVGEVFRYFIKGSRWTSMDRKEVQDWLLNRQFRAVDGIVDSTGVGGPTKIYLVSVDPERMNALGVSNTQVANAIASSNGTTGGSYISANDINYMVRGEGLLKNVKDIGSVVISTKNGVPVRVRDVARVAISEGIRQGQVGVNEDDDAVEGILLMRRGENASRAIGNVRAAWKDAERVLPKGMELVPLYDRTALVRNTVGTISHSVAEGIVLVVSLLLLFLFQVRSALICAAVIPFALLTAFTLLNVFQVPANLLSLGAIDFGIIIDGSIILTENVVRRLSSLSKDASVDAALVYRTIAASTAEMARPIFIATAIIMLTFLPVLSFDHVEGKLFRPLAIMMNFTLIGAVIAVTFMVPALCAFAYNKDRLPKHRQSPVLKPIQAFYERVLQSALNFPKATMCAIVALSLLAISTLPFIGSEFLPELEEGNIWLSVTVLPTSVSLERSVQIASEIRHIIRSYPEVTNVVSHVGGPDDGTDPMGYNFIQVLVDLQPQSTWRKQVGSKSALINSMEAEIEAKRPGLVLNFSQYIKDNMDEAMSGVRNGEYAVKIYGPDIDVLEGLSASVSAMLKTIPGFCDIARDHLAGQPQIAVKIDFDKAARYGISAQDVLDVVETAIGGKPVTKIIDGERRFDVILRLEKEYRSSPAEIGNILLTTPSGARIPLAQVATVTCEQGASNITREENRRRTAVYAQIRGRDLGSTVLAAQKMVSEKLVLPEGYTVKYAGQFERAIEAGKRLCIFVPITLCMIFILLYAAFSSASLAAVVLSVVPIATGAGIIILLISGVHLSISSGVGFIALFGLCIQNAVILTARMKELTELGLAPRMAAFRGASDKLQAVVTASSVAVIGLVPAAIATGIGSQSQKPFALVIAGGLLPATALLLLAVPICYAFAVGRNKTIKLEEAPKQAEPVS